ncbi:MAG: polysaccharide pyruvyl transferase family protein [Coriobacteriia bacterium]|nr:polysaccharide pyruvyl transferase family protein [Coriobacteriia bacterium]
MTNKQGKAKVGILTWHYYSNVGSNLQAWAMQHLLVDMGFDVRFVNYRRRELDGERFPKGLAKPILNALPFGPSFDAWRFQRDELRQTRKTYDPADARAICDGFDALVCGSDQIWAPNVFNPVYMLAGVSDGVRKVAYAASIGLPDIPAALRSEYRSLLSRFDAIGVREEQGRDLLVNELGLDAITVLDPTFLVSRDTWLSVADDARVANGPYVFCYFLGSPSRYSDAVQKAARQTGLPVITYLPEAGEAEIPGCRTLRRMAVPEFLGWLSGASLVMTDSFHGIALSVNLGVEFCAYKRFDEGDALDQNSRVLNILGKLGLLGRLLPLGECCVPEIDWDVANARLTDEVAASRRFLAQALDGVGGGA